MKVNIYFTFVNAKILNICVSVATNQRHSDVECDTVESLRPATKDEKIVLVGDDKTHVNDGCFPLRSQNNFWHISYSVNMKPQTQTYAEMGLCYC